MSPSNSTTYDTGHVHIIVPLEQSSHPRESSQGSKEAGACRDTTGQELDIEKEGEMLRNIFGGGLERWLSG